MADLLQRTPADAVINRLDDKAYGAVSVSYLAFGPSIQDAVNEAYDGVSNEYNKRLQQVAVNAHPPSIDDFRHELKRAACDNLTQGTQFSMLSELVDTMLILQKGSKGEASVTSTPPVYAGFGPSSSSNFPTTASTEGALPLVKARFSMQSTVEADKATAADEPEVTPLSVYTANQWMARQLLLTQTITATVTAPRTDGSPRPTPFQNIETADEGLVKQIADAATAKAIDDATRLNPTMLDQFYGDVASQIQSSVNVVTAATAVSQASAVLKLNVSISNVNTFSPVNQNTVAPVITVPPSSAPSASLSPCTSADFGSIGVSCFDHGGSMVLTFSRQHFRSDSCMPDDLAPALTAVGNMLKGYRARTGVGYYAALDGHASLPAARLARCPGTAAEPAHLCDYVNALRQSVLIVGCDGKHKNRNVILSAQRARAAARALELAADGAVIVHELQACGTDTASKREAGAAASIDQAVVIRLTPAVKP